MQQERESESKTQTSSHRPKQAVVMYIFKYCCIGSSGMADEDSNPSAVWLRKLRVKSESSNNDSLSTGGRKVDALDA